MGVGEDVLLGRVSLTISTRKGSSCDGYKGAQALGEGLPEGKFWMSACGVCGGVSGPLTVCCVDLLATGTVSGSDVKVTLCVTRATRDGTSLEGPPQGSVCDVPLLLLVIITVERIWAGLPLIYGANHFELADFQQ